MKSKVVLTCLLIFISFILFSSCAGSKKSSQTEESAGTQSGSETDYDEIERLLGLDRESEAEKKQEVAEKQQQGKEKDDDLITLLEVDENRKTEAEPEASTNGHAKETQSAQAGESAENDLRVQRLQDQNERMRKEVNEKNMEVADLKAQLLLLQQRLDSQSTQTTPTVSSDNSGGYAGGGKIPPGSYQNRYNEALELFRQAQYRDALRAFEQLLASDTGNNLSDNAQYWLGESYYALGRYQEAILAFEKVFTFRFSNKDDYAQFKIGQSYYKLNNPDRARQEFQELLDSYPDSPLVSRAKQYLDEL
ncbi:MAG: tetratricopeptide repeat protein [Calditrichia bacterium]